VVYQCFIVYLHILYMLKR